MSEKDREIDITLDSLVQHISDNRHKILDDFYKAYIAESDEKFRIQDLTLVEKMMGNGETNWWFEINRIDDEE